MRIVGLYLQAFVGLVAVAVLLVTPWQAARCNQKKESISEHSGERKT